MEVKEMYIATSTLESILKAIMLSKLADNAAIIHQKQQKNSLFQTGTKVDNYDFKTVYLKYIQEYKRIEWLEAGKINALQKSIFFYDRHQQVSFGLMVKVCKQALEQGVGYVLSKVSNEACKFREQASSVKKELHRMHGFIRLTPCGDSRIMTGYAEPEHNIGDLIVARFRKQYQDKVIIINTPDNTYIGDEKGVYISKVPSKDFSKLVEEEQSKDEFKEYWLTYYKSQFIESRKNRRLAMQNLPQKYWSWLAEGQCME